LLHNQNNQITFRIAQQADISDIVSLVESAYRGASSFQGWTTEAAFIDGQRTDDKEVTELMSKSDSIFMLCYQSQQLTGSVQLERQKDKAYLGMFAVDPDIQGSGFGSSLLKQAESYARDEWDSKAMRMTVITIRDELINWYLRQGYTATGIFKQFPYEEPRFGRPKRNDLMLEIYEKKI